MEIELAKLVEIWESWTIWPISVDIGQSYMDTIEY